MGASKLSTSAAAGSASPGTAKWRTASRAANKGSKHDEKLEQKSPAKPVIKEGSGALDDKDLEWVIVRQLEIVAMVWL
jgi:hypothetical protein